MPLHTKAYTQFTRTTAQGRVPRRAPLHITANATTWVVIDFPDLTGARSRLIAQVTMEYY